jgi:hypothetical protein
MRVACTGSTISNYTEHTSVADLGTSATPLDKADMVGLIKVCLGLLRVRFKDDLQCNRLQRGPFYMTDQIHYYLLYSQYYFSILILAALGGNYGNLAIFGC